MIEKIKVMNLIKISFFQKNADLCGADFKNQNKIDIINLDFLLSISEIEAFYTPFTNEFRGKYGVITMSNGDKYYVKEELLDKFRIELGERLNLQTWIK
jgi:hypothetical protein